MPLFAYQARDKSGERVSGTREAPDQRAALEALREQGFFVTQLGPSKSGGLFNREKHERASEVRSRPEEATPQSCRPAPGATPPPPRSTTGATQGAHTSTGAPLPTNLWATANAKELSLFFRQMNSMLNAGTGMGAALNTMAQHGPSPSLRRASAEMSRATSQGTPWSETMRAYPSLFDALAIGMVAAGEAGGFLDRMCQRLADYSERDYELQQTIKRETWYPKLLLFCSILIPSVVPAVVAFNNGQNVLAAWLQTVALPLGIVGGCWLLWMLSKRVAPIAALLKPLMLVVDQLKLTIPGVSKMSRALAAAKFSRALGALYASGMGVGRAIDIAAGASGNVAMAESARRVIPQVERGVSLSEAMASTNQMPPIALQMLSTGEMTGNVDTQLDKVADFMEQDAETAIKQVVKALSLLIYLFVAAYIGYIVISMFGQYLSGLTSLLNE